MNWDALGAIAELVGALAVVTTVAYLAIQIRNEKMRSIREDRRVRSERIANAYMELADGDHLPGVLVKVSDHAKSETGWRRVAEATGLEPLEAIRYSLSRQGLMHGFQLSFTDKDIAEGERESALMRLRYTIKQDGLAFEEFWKVLGPTFLPEFRSVVDEELNQDGDA